MGQMILGLALFLGVHSVSIFALGFRNRMVAKNTAIWKIGYSLIALAGLILIVRGYGEARLDPTVLYTAPAWFRHVAALLLLPVFILLPAPYLPGRIRQKTRHPMLVAVKLWALAHLLVNGTLADVVLFGSFLAWAVADRISLKRRPASGAPAPAGTTVNDVILVVAGLGIYVLFAFWAHRVLFGVAPFG